MKEIIFNEGQLNRFTKKQIIELFLSQQEQLQKQTTQLEELNHALVKTDARISAD